MIDEGIFDGDTVLISKITNVNNGDIVVALIDKEEATLKNLEKRVIVSPLNLLINIIKPKYTDQTGLRYKEKCVLLSENICKTYR